MFFKEWAYVIKPYRSPDDNIGAPVM